MAKTITEAVNLDALIEREDFETAGDATAGGLGSELYLNNLRPDSQLALMRKPDFQRETSSWSPEIVAEFIKSVADGDVIPALIMWRSPSSGKIFVIDGAHRLSALVAWINDDYGDGTRSREFYGNNITGRQEEIARKTRDLVATVGKYNDLIGYARNPSSAPSPLLQKRGSNILAKPLSIQKIEGDALAAEHSYKRINSTAVAISTEELELIETRRLPTGIAARALMRAGTGYEYWGHLLEPHKSQIKETAALVYDQLIEPIATYPVLALDLPAPKRGYSANSLKTIVDLVRIVNTFMGGPKKLEVDTSGVETLQHLERIRSATTRVYGRKHSGSLALHPALYCYDRNGKFVPKAFIGAIQFVVSLERKDKFYEFTKHRKSFEDFLIRNRHIITQLGTQGSGGRRGVPAVLSLYTILFDGLCSGLAEEKIIETLKADKVFGSLEWNQTREVDAGERFSAAQKAAAVIRTALERDICPECGGRLYIKDRSHDHNVRKEDGGLSVSANLNLTHPYCNTGYKEKRTHDERTAGV